jgi:ABC-2 type transport system ATP-binding protein
MTTTTAIDVTGMVKTFGKVRALDGLNLSVDTGEVHGFLGPNGAGKSTAIKVLLGQLRADAGSATVLGGDPWRDAVELHRRLAYVPGDVNRVRLFWRDVRPPKPPGAVLVGLGLVLAGGC